MIDGLRARGPDAFRQERVVVRSGLAACELALIGAVLHMRGEAAEPTEQPLCGGGLALLWNGELFGGDGVQVGARENDTRALLDAMLRADGAAAAAAAAAPKSPFAVLSRVEGPWAFALWDAKRACLWFGRDRVGRRSLVACVSRDALLVSSVAPLAEAAAGVWFEVPTGGLFCVDLSGAAEAKGAGPIHASVSFHAWPAGAPYAGRVPQSLAEATEGLLRVLSESVRRRVTASRQPSSANAARVAVLFSGGVDCTVLAALCHRHLPPSEPVDLVNVAFAGRRLGARAERHARLAALVPDRVTALNGWLELSQAFPSRTWRLIEVDVSLGELARRRDRVLALTRPATTVMDFNIGAMLWFAARAEGFEGECPAAPIRSRFCRYGARADGAASRRASDSDEAAEDALPQKRVRAARRSRAPAQAQAAASDPAEAEPRVRSSARVLLIGLGADEQLGGYGRHRTVFRRRGEAALAAELEMDVERLWRRNMGRDDRVTADAGRELLHPFLDEHVVAYLRALPLRFKCDLTAPPGTGDKLVLREAARWLGLRRAASLQKRAIQFGTRIANRKIGGEGAFDRGVDVAQVVNQRLIAD